MSQVYAPIIKAHALIAVTTWTIVAPTAILVARFYKRRLAMISRGKDHQGVFTLNWFPIHVSLQLLTICLLLLSMSFSLVTPRPLSGVHAALGLFLACILVFQPVMGIVARFGGDFETVRYPSRVANVSLDPHSRKRDSGEKPPRVLHVSIVEPPRIELELAVTRPPLQQAVQKDSDTTVVNSVAKSPVSSVPHVEVEENAAWDSGLETRASTHTVDEMYAAQPQLPLALLMSGGTGSSLGISHPADQSTELAGSSISSTDQHLPSDQSLADDIVTVPAYTPDFEPLTPPEVVSPPRSIPLPVPDPTRRISNARFYRAPSRSTSGYSDFSTNDVHDTWWTYVKDRAWSWLFVLFSARVHKIMGHLCLFLAHPTLALTLPPPSKDSLPWISHGTWCTTYIVSFLYLEYLRSRRHNTHLHNHKGRRLRRMYDKTQAEEVQQKPSLEDPNTGYFAMGGPTDPGHVMDGDEHTPETRHDDDHGEGIRMRRSYGEDPDAEPLLAPLPRKRDQTLASTEIYDRDRSRNERASTSSPLAVLAVFVAVSIVDTVLVTRSIFEHYN